MNRCLHAGCAIGFHGDYLVVGCQEEEEGRAAGTDGALRGHSTGGAARMHLQAGGKHTTQHADPGLFMGFAHIAYTYGPVQGIGNLA